MEDRGVSGEINAAGPGVEDGCVGTLGRTFAGWRYGYRKAPVGVAVQCKGERVKELGCGRQGRSICARDGYPSVCGG